MEVDDHFDPSDLGIPRAAELENLEHDLLIGARGRTDKRGDEIIPTPAGVAAQERDGHVGHIRCYSGHR
jgi:hypothetical protein